MNGGRHFKPTTYQFSSPARRFRNARQFWGKSILAYDYLMDPRTNKLSWILAEGSVAKTARRYCQEMMCVHIHTSRESFSRRNIHSVCAAMIIAPDARSSSVNAIIILIGRHIRQPPRISLGVTCRNIRQVPIGSHARANSI